MPRLSHRLLAWAIHLVSMLLQKIFCAVKPLSLFVFLCHCFFSHESFVIKEHCGVQPFLKQVIFFPRGTWQGSHANSWEHCDMASNPVDTHGKTDGCNLLQMWPGAHKSSPHNIMVQKFLAQCIRLTDTVMDRETN